MSKNLRKLKGKARIKEKVRRWKRDGKKVAALSGPVIEIPVPPGHEWWRL